jgi:FlaA1/EpsC-like NDP-sugar epimerase
MFETLPLILFIKLGSFYYFRLFSGFWRYVSMDDLIQIIKASLMGSVLFLILVVFLKGLTGFPRSIFLLDWMICTGLVSGARMVNRFFRELSKGDNKPDKISKGLIYGAGEAGILVLKELRDNLDIEVTGFIDDDPVKRGMNIYGKKVLGRGDEISDISEKYAIDTIVIAMPKLGGSEIRQIISQCTLSGLNVKILPGLYKLLSGEIEIKLREVKPEDLLGRETVKIDQEDVRKYVEDKTVLITGAAGSIGSEISRQVAKYFPQRMILVDHNENDLYFLEREFDDSSSDMEIEYISADIKEIPVLKNTFSKYKPDIVFHAAAFKHVPLMESNPSSAVKNNVICSRNLIYASDHYGVERFVLISSDKAVNPTNIMGATKRITEMIMQAKSRKSRTKFMAVRFGNVLGSKGSVVPLFKKQIEEKRRVTVTHPEARRFFMSVGEAVQLVLQAGALGEGGEVFVLDMGEQIKISELARNLIMLSGYKPDEDITIEYIGLRPGEKLFEEPLHDSEKDTATRNEKIYIARPDDIDIKWLLKRVKELDVLSKRMRNSAIIEKIQEIVPAYRNGGTSLLKRQDAEK